MSERIVTSLPKCLSDSTMRGSRESVRSSHGSVRGSTDSLWRGVASCENVASLSTSCSASTTTLSTDVNSVRRRPRGHWKLLKRAVCRWINSHTHRSLRASLMYTPNSSSSSSRSSRSSRSRSRRRRSRRRRRRRRSSSTRRHLRDAAVYT